MWRWPMVWHMLGYKYSKITYVHQWPCWMIRWVEGNSLGKCWPCRWWHRRVFLLKGTEKWFALPQRNCHFLIPVFLQKSTAFIFRCLWRLFHHTRVGKRRTLNSWTCGFGTSNGLWTYYRLSMVVRFQYHIALEFAFPGCLSWVLVLWGFISSYTRCIQLLILERHALCGQNITEKTGCPVTVKEHPDKILSHRPQDPQAW